MAITEMIRERWNAVVNDIAGINRMTLQFCLGTFVTIVLISWLRIRPLGILFLAILGFWFYRTQMRIRVILSPELKQKFHNGYQRVRDCQQKDPQTFLVVALASLISLAIFGHYVSGSMVVIAVFTAAAIISTKFNIILFRHEERPECDMPRSVVQPEVDLDDEFLPEASANNMCVLQRASDLNTLSYPIEAEGEEEEEKSDEVPSEFLIEEVPELTENTTDEEDNDVDELLPIVRNAVQANENMSHKASAQIADKDKITFKKSHFKDAAYSLRESSSSSSSEESLSKGLVFPDHLDIDNTDSSRSNQGFESQFEGNGLLAAAVKAQTQAIIANSGKILPNLLSSLVQMSGSLSTGSSSNPSASASARFENDDVIIEQNPSSTSSSGNPTQNKSKVQKKPSAASNAAILASALESSDDSDFEILQNDDFI